MTFFAYLTKVKVSMIFRELSKTVFKIFLAQSGPKFRVWTVCSELGLFSYSGYKNIFFLEFSKRGFKYNIRPTIYSKNLCVKSINNLRIKIQS